MAATAPNVTDDGDHDLSGPDAAGPNGSGRVRAASVILNVIEVLRCFTVDEPLQGVTEIAAKVGLHKSSVSRILATLEEQEVVERDPASRKFRLGLGLLAMAGPLLANLDVRQVSLPTLQDLSATTRETAALMLWSGSEAVTVEQVASPMQVKHTNPLGARHGTALSASVQVFLAEMPADRVRQLLGQGLPSLPDGSTAVEDYVGELAQVRERGYAVNLGQTSPEEVGIAAPVRDHRGDVVAAVLLAAPFFRVGPDRVAELGAACVAAAARVSARLGAVSP
ncbi:IclR family transcriptional regulator [Georgenia soli]|uniref:IclR family transcriptional regulator n=1 Tax=Georgenia soli TaxID=638953 RepID=A0A2A9ENJ8_9MICO|nr:IclR family transcriptional regulator [Georgenia soli]PFG40111.1 IclR family transcriptional regulator [Georgenia soli]